MPDLWQWQSSWTWRSEMKHNNAKKPTRKQCRLLEKYGFNFRDWLVMTENKSEIRVVNRHTGAVRTLEKI
mgnify:CR=1 FL=1